MTTVGGRDDTRQSPHPSPPTMPVSLDPLSTPFPDGDWEPGTTVLALMLTAALCWILRHGASALCGTPSGPIGPLWLRLGACLRRWRPRLPRFPGILLFVVNPSDSPPHLHHRRSPRHSHDSSVSSEEPEEPVPYLPSLEPPRCSPSGMGGTSLSPSPLDRHRRRNDVSLTYCTSSTLCRRVSRSAQTTCPFDDQPSRDSFSSGSMGTPPAVLSPSLLRAQTRLAS